MASHPVAMEQKEAAKVLAELGNETRLAIFRLLVKSGAEGAPVGHIQRETGVPASTLSHHISRLVAVGLIVQERESRILHCRPQFARLRDVTTFLLDECCVGISETTPETSAA